MRSTGRSLVAERTVEISVKVLKMRFSDTTADHRFHWSITTLTSENLAEPLVRLAEEIAKLDSKLGVYEAFCRFRHTCAPYLLVVLRRNYTLVSDAGCDPMGLKNLTDV
jgi:hypothetical protein